MIEYQLGMQIILWSNSDVVNWTRIIEWSRVYSRWQRAGRTATINTITSGESGTILYDKSPSLTRKCATINVMCTYTSVTNFFCHRKQV